MINESGSKRLCGLIHVAREWRPTGELAENGAPVHGMGISYADWSTTYSAFIERLRNSVAAADARANKKSPQRRAVRFEKLLAELSEVDEREVLTEVVVALKSASRDPYIHKFEEHFRALDEARKFVEIAEMYLDQLSSREIDDLMSGAQVPRKAGAKPDHARANQFEFFFGALLAGAGLNPRKVEPDIAFDLGGVLRSAAVKRLETGDPQRAAEVLKKGAKQISSSGLPGFLIVDVTVILNPSKTFFTRFDRAKEVVGPPLLHQVNNEFRRAFSPQNEAVLGTILYASFPMLGEHRTFGSYEIWLPAKEGRQPRETEMLLAALVRGNRRSLR